MPIPEPMEILASSVIPTKHRSLKLDGLSAQMPSVFGSSTDWLLQGFGACDCSQPPSSPSRGMQPLERYPGNGFLSPRPSMKRQSANRISLPGGKNSKTSVRNFTRKSCSMGSPQALQMANAEYQVTANWCPQSGNPPRWARKLNNCLM